jgi:hypothetical protein
MRRKGLFARYQSLPGPELVTIPVFRVDTTRTSYRRLVVLLPHVQADGTTGGPNTVLNLTARVARHGLHVHYVGLQDSEPHGRAAFLDYVRDLTNVDVPAARVTIDAAGEERQLRIHENDVFLATMWTTAHVARAAIQWTRAKEFVYLIQDFEPGFYAWSTPYALALDTYSCPCRALVNESLLLSHLERECSGGNERGRRAQWRSFEPAVDRGLFRPPVDPTRQPELLFYARPSQPRNLFDLGLSSLRKVAQEGLLNGWRCRAVGSAIPRIPLSEHVELEPTPWYRYSHYAASLSQAELLVSLMLSPHTSYPPLEMAASGGRVVTTAFGTKTSNELRQISPAIEGAAPTSEQTTAAIRSAVREIEREREAGWGVASAARLARAGEMKMPSNWDEALADIVPWVVSTVCDLSDVETL